MFKQPYRTGVVILLTLSALLIAGCRSIPMPKGSSKPYATVQFITPNEPLGADSSPAFVEANRMIQKAIAEQMEQHGLKVVESGGDLIIAHLILLQDSTRTLYSNQYFGQQDFSKFVELAHKKGMKQNYPATVQKRALVIDVSDVKTNTLVYRHYAVREAMPQLSEIERQDELNKVVAEILAPFFQ